MIIGVFLLDLIKFIIIFHFIFGYDFTKAKKQYVSVLLLIICCVIGLLSLHHSGDRVYITLPVMVIAMLLLFDGEKFSILKAGILTKIAASIVDVFVLGIILLGYGGRKTSIALESQMNLFSTFIGLLLFLLISLVLRKYSCEINGYMQCLTLKKFLYHCAYLLVSGLVIGYAGLIALDDTEVLRAKATVVIIVSLFGILIVISGVLTEILALQKNSLKQLVEANEECIREQTRQYFALNQRQNELRSFKHDYNAHMQTLQTLLTKGECVKLEDYIESLQEMQKSFDGISANNIIADAILNEYYWQGLEKGINLILNGKFPSEINISETDLTIILSNVIKNAYEAAEKCTGTNKEISMTITHSPNRVYLQVKNPAISVPKLENGIIVSNKDDKDNHGIGLRNIEMAVKRYQGAFNMTFDSGYMVVELEF